MEGIEIVQKYYDQDPQLEWERLSRHPVPALLQQPEPVICAWIDFAERLCEREDLLNFSEHFLYIGRKCA